MRRRPVIMYHSVDTLPDPMSVQVTPARLRQQLTVLRRLGLRGVSMRELLAPTATGRLVGLTFDDGYTDFASTAQPILEEFGFTGTVYVVAGRMGGSNEWDPPPRRSLMTADQVTSVHAAGHEIGCHGMWHQRVDELPPEALNEEVVASRSLLEDAIDAPVTGFCYPYGVVSPAALASARETYEYACAIRPESLDDKWALPRFHVGEADGALRLVAKLALRPVRERMHRGA